MKNKTDGSIIEDETGLAPTTPDKLYKFRALQDGNDLERIKDIIDEGFYCTDFLNFNDMNEGVYVNNEKNVNIELSNKIGYKICSFSEEGALSSELMWGHYTNAGKGVAIEVRVKNFPDLHKVQYIDHKNDLDTIQDILTHKSTVWSYEKEWRYLKESNVNPVNIGKITRIYFGTPYAILENYDEIKNNHKSLSRYLKLKKELELYCKDIDIDIDIDIECEDYAFGKLKI